MKTLVLGSGAREHTIVWKFAQSNRIAGLFAAPGNAGTAELCDNVRDLDPTDSDRIIRFVAEKQINLVFIGPEAPLAAGVADDLQAAGIPVIGPGKQAAQLEASKSFSKEFMRRYKIPTADSTNFDSLDGFEQNVTNRSGKIVIKKSGLAAGKGVLESDNTDEILAFGNDILKSDSLLIEEFLTGWELSAFALTDGEHYQLLPYCADFKKAGDEDRGENTGGMGAICPVPQVTNALSETIEETIIRPTFEGMRKDGLSYKGVLYFGLMITKDGPKLLEYNVRFGDPESQVLLPLIQSDIGNLCEAILQGRIDSFPLRILPDYAVGVVVASGGYPAKYKTGMRVENLPDPANRKLQVFHASTTRNASGETETGGGRCFTVVGIGQTILTANQRAYEAVSSVSFEGAWYRTDIGQKFLIQE